MSVTFSKVAATLLKVTLIHRCFSHFLNRENGTKLRKAFHLLMRSLLPLLMLYY